jgi:hypothetical protein
MSGGEDQEVETSVELRAKENSQIDNSSALRSGVNRIEVLEGYRRQLRDLLHECRRALIKERNAPLVNRINKLLKETLD